MDFFPCHFSASENRDAYKFTLNTIIIAFKNILAYVWRKPILEGHTKSTIALDELFKIEEATISVVLGSFEIWLTVYTPSFLADFIEQFTYINQRWIFFVRLPPLIVTISVLIVRAFTPVFVQSSFSTNTREGGMKFIESTQRCLRLVK